MNWRSPYALLILATCLWGGNFVVGKVLVADVPPILLATLRWCIALIVITPIYAKEAWKHRALFLEKWKMLTFLSLTGVAGFNTLVYIAVQYTSSINAAVMNAATPILIIMVSWVMLKEPISLKTIPGIGLSMLGVLWMITRGSWDVLVGLSFNKGDLWMLAAILCWALYSVGMRRSAKQVPAQALFVYTIIISVVLLIPLSVVEVLLVKPVLHISLGIGSGIVYIGVFASLVAFSAWNQSIALIGPARCAGFLNLIPLFSTIFATAFTGESIHFYHFVGAALILTGIYTANRRQKLKQSAP